MLLVTITINSEEIRISDEPVSLDHYWDAAIIDFAGPTMTMPTDYGGYCRLNMGDITLVPSLFIDDWPPPRSCAITVKYTDTTESAAITIFTGLVTRREINYEQVVYTFKSPDYDETVADATSYSSLLSTDLDTILTGISEISTFNDDAMRASPPTVTYTTSGERLSIELASAICGFYTHMFYIDGTRAYCVDMLGNNGISTLTEYEFFPPNYWDKEPVASIKETSTGDDTTVFSDYPHGRSMEIEAYNTGSVVNTTSMNNIMTLENRPRCSVDIPLSGSIPLPGEKISWTDTRVEKNTAVSLYARTFRYNFRTGFVNIEGDAVIAAA